MSYDLDEDILQDFLVEAGEILELLSEQLVELENNPEDKDLLNAIFRGFHTVKGAAGSAPGRGGAAGHLREALEQCRQLPGERLFADDLADHDGAQRRRRPPPPQRRWAGGTADRA